MGMIQNEVLAQTPRLWFICRCGLVYRRLTELVEHWEDEHSQPALAAFIPGRFQKEEYP